MKLKLLCKHNHSPLLATKDVSLMLFQRKGNDGSYRYKESNLPMDRKYLKYKGRQIFKRLDTVDY